MSTSKSTGNESVSDSKEPNAAPGRAMLEAIDAMMAIVGHISLEAKPDSTISALLHSIADKWPDISLGVFTLSPDQHPIFITLSSTTYLKLPERPERFFSDIEFVNSQKLVAVTF